MSVEALEMSCAEEADALAPQVWDLKPDDLHYSLLYPVLPFCYLFWGLSRLGLHELAVMCHLRLNPGLAQLDRHVATVGKPLPETLLSFAIYIFESHCTCHIQIQFIQNQFIQMYFSGKEYLGELLKQYSQSVN